MLEFRDLNQLQNSPPFAWTAVESFLNVERELSDVLKVIPYCEDHKNVWSPQLAGIILEAASQLDSIWKASTKLDEPSTATDKLTIKDHRKRFELMVSNQFVVLFAAETASIITPFFDWQANANSSPAWWVTYNSLKHDRFSNHTKATVTHAVNAVAGLLLGIVYSGNCDSAIINANLLDSADYNPWAFTDTGKLRGVNGLCCSKIETKMMAHPLGIVGKNSHQIQSFWRSNSPRFNAWWSLNFARLFPVG